MAEVLDFDPNKSSGDLIEASNQQRFFNYIIDIVVYIILLGVLIALTGKEYSEDMLNIVFIVAYVLLSAIFEALFGKTPGKFITKTHVVTKDGLKPSLLNILGRNLCRLIPFDSLSFLFGSRGWHDKFSDTFVVKD